MRILLLAIFLTSLMSCSTDNAFEKELITTVYYEFYDSSVPPEYHRSFEIKIEKDEAMIKVDSYGDILHSSTHQVSDKDFDKLVELMNNASLRSCEILEPEPCSGGTGEKLTIFEGSVSTELYLDHCGSNDEYPSTCGDVRAVINFIKSLIPDLEEKLQ